MNDPVKQVDLDDGCKSWEQQHDGAGNRLGHVRARRQGAVPRALFHIAFSNSISSMYSVLA
jgi:hypothetical protein